MSTWLYLQCLDHDPPLIASDESGQHLSDLPQIHADINLSEEFLANDINDLEYFRRNSYRFLIQHRSCRITVLDENGREHPPGPEPLKKERP